MVETKPYYPPEGNESKNSTEKQKVQATKKNNYQCNKTWTKTQGPEPEAKTEFKGRCSNLEVYIFNLGPRASDKFARTMKELEIYLVETYINIWQPDIMTETPATSPNPDMPKTIPSVGSERPKIDREMSYLKKKYINEAIRQKPRKKDVYENDMQKIYNIIVGKKDEQL